MTKSNAEKHSHSVMSNTIHSTNLTVPAFTVGALDLGKCEEF